MARLDMGRLRSVAALTRKMGWSGFFKSLIALTAANLVASVMGLVDSVFAIPTMAFNALAQVSPAVFRAVLIDPLSIPGTAVAVVNNWLMGPGALTGPFAFAIGVASVLLGVGVFSLFMDAMNWDIVGDDVFGISLFGNDDEGG